MDKKYIKLRNTTKEFLAKFNKPKKLEFPKVITIETSVRCNANCIMCPHKSIKRKKDMDFSLFKKIIDEASNYDIDEIHPMNYGEPFLYKHFIKVLKYTKRKIKEAKIFIYTNGSVMTRKQMEEILKDNLIDYINFSLDAINPKTFARVHRLDYEITIKKINQFLELNKNYSYPVFTYISFALNKYNESELKEFTKYWKNKVNKVHVGCDDGRYGKPFVNKASKNPCRTVFERTTILTDGSVVLCCIDAKGTFILGNINKNTIKEIWDNKKYELVRRLHLHKNKDKIPLCKKCNVRY